jgi:hypothetical protein
LVVLLAEERARYGRVDPCTLGGGADDGVGVELSVFSCRRRHLKGERTAAPGDDDDDQQKEGRARARSRPL